MFEFTLPHLSKSAEQEPGRHLNLGDLIEAFLTTPNSSANPIISSYLQKSRHLSDDKFEVKVDVTHFAPEEINVKVVDNSIMVEAKHAEKEDKFGFISRQFNRRFVLPEGVILEKMTCKMAPDNTSIVISAPRLVKKPPVFEKTIPIQFLGNSESDTPNASSEPTLMDVVNESPAETPETKVSAE